MLKKFFALAVALSSICALSAAPAVTLSGAGVEKTSYKTIQDALDGIKGDGEFTISIPKGIYEEVLYYNGPATVRLLGETSEKYGSDVIIAKANNGDLSLNTRASGVQKRRCLFEFEGSGNLILENLTLHNTYVRGTVKGSNTQAETLGYDGTGWVASYNCSFKSTQDTLRMTGKTWFYKCFVEGDTDFIWMESAGKVALFEECEIYSHYDEKHSAHTSYIGAPRMEIGSTAGKGLVIFNSNISCATNQKTYFGRTPWSSGYYNQLAFINTKASGIAKEVWSGIPLTAPGVERTKIGWKMDTKTSKNIKASIKGRNDIVPESEVKTEFAGRDAILNRYFDILSDKYRKDLDTNWNATELAEKLGWKVSKDKSSSLLKGEVESKKIVYSFDGTGDLSSLKINGFAQEQGKSYFVGNAGSSITVPLVSKAILKITGLNAGNGTIKTTNQGESSYDFNNGSTETTIDKYYVVYEGATDFTLTADAKTYISKITVESDESLNLRPVTAIEVKSHKNKNEVMGKKNIQMSAVLTPLNPTNPEYSWSVSNTDAAEIDQNGFLKAKSVTQDTVIKVIATAKDSNAVKGEKELKILKPEEGSFSATWLSTVESTKTLQGIGDAPEVITAQNAIPSKGSWAYNQGKITSDVAKAALTYSDYSEDIKGRDKVYIDLPITAKQKLILTDVEVAYGNHGTGNIACQIMWLKGGERGNIFDDDSRAVRNTKKSYKVVSPKTVEKGETITVRIILYGLGGSSDIPIPTGKSPTIGTITVNGKAIK
ncbi:pectinesterase family protein [Treponema pectinovorum]|uniref:pectinesterase family protein n=1 Tax=Treponema pectinovorum TaxID=164 RepID=UPI003D8AB972